MFKIWTNEIVPDKRNPSPVCPLHENGNIMVCSNYRRISFLYNVYKISSDILFGRLSPYVEDIIANFNEFQTETHHLFTGF
jgi:hypothetical protein